MSDLNSVVIEGNLTRDVDIRFVPSGTAVASFSVAVNKQFLKDGEKQESVSFIDVVAWGKQAESCGKYLAKGSHVIVEGSLEQRRWEKDGDKKSKIEIVAKPFGIHFKSKRKETNGQAQEPGEDSPPVDEGEIPF